MTLVAHETETNHQKTNKKEVVYHAKVAEVAQQWEKHYTEDHGVNKCFIYLCHVTHDLITRTRYWLTENITGVVKREKICVCSYVEEVKPATFYIVLFAI